MGRSCGWAPLALRRLGGKTAWWEEFVVGHLLLYGGLGVRPIDGKKLWLGTGVAFGGFKGKVLKDSVYT